MSFKICIIGCGGHSGHVHGPSLKRYRNTHADTVLAACCDLNAEKAASYQERFGFERCYTDVATMLDTEQPHAVSVVLPEFVQGKAVMQVIRKGYPVMLEKPPGKSVEEVMELTSLAHKHQVPNQVAFNRRYHPIVQEMKRILHTEFAEEPIQNIRFHMDRFNRTENIFWATAIHGIDLVKDMAGSDFKHIDIFYQDFPTLGTNVSNIFMHAVFQRGITAQMHFCPVTGINTENVCVHLKDHTFLLDIGYHTKGRLRQYTNRNDILRTVLGEELIQGEGMYLYCGYYHENELFFEDIRNGRRPKGDLASCVQTMQVANAVAQRKTSYDFLWD